MPTWNPHLYLQFASERTQPSIDLIGRIQLSHPARIIDLGCGPGNSTMILRQRWTKAEMIGLDSSAEMIATASDTYPNEKWIVEDIVNWKADRQFDLVFSNATLQWLPDHERLFPHLLAQVAPGGAMAVQLPAHDQSPLHQVTINIANDPMWSQRMNGAKTALTRKSPSFYYNLLRPLSTHIDLWETEYYHQMDSPQAIVNWFRGTGLRPFLESLENEAEKQCFEQRLLAGYTQAYLPQKDGRILFPFRRLFMIAYR